MDENQKVQKVKPYPFPIILFSGVQPKPSKAQVLRLAQHGAVIQLQEQVLMVGTEFPVEFSTPVQNAELKLTAKVIKTYDRVNPKGGAPERLAEIHFKGITSEEIKKIYQFLVAIRQVG